jgi:hypothetical protein
MYARPPVTIRGCSNSCEGVGSKLDPLGTRLDRDSRCKSLQRFRCLLTVSRAGSRPRRAAPQGTSTLRRPVGAFTPLTVAVQPPVPPRPPANATQGGGEGASAPPAHNPAAPAAPSSHQPPAQPGAAAPHPLSCSATAAATQLLAPDGSPNEQQQVVDSHRAWRECLQRPCDWCARGHAPTASTQLAAVCWLPPARHAAAGGVASRRQRHFSATSALAGLVYMRRSFSSCRCSNTTGMDRH